MTVYRLKTRLVGGEAGVTIVFRGNIVKNKPTISVSKDSYSNVDAQTKFISDIIGGVPVVKVMELLKLQFADIASSQLKVLPNLIAIPDEPDPLEFTTVSAIFNAVMYTDKALPAFEVNQAYIHAKNSVACSYRAQFLAVQ